MQAKTGPRKIYATSKAYQTLSQPGLTLGVSYSSQAYLPGATSGGSWQVGQAPGKECAAKV
jgi:hypothetical protein